MEEVKTFTGMTFTDEPDLVEEGEYEFVIDSADKKMPKNGGSDYLSLKFKIRSDVDQSSKGRILFVNVFKDKDNPSWYDYNTLKRIIATQKETYTDGRKWSVSFETCDDCVQYLVGKKLRAEVIHETYTDMNGEEQTRAAIRRGSYLPSLHKGTAASTPLSDSDLPF